MSVARSKPIYTVVEYLEIERESKDRHFYFDGEIYAMAGESVPHGDISVNIAGLLFVQLKGTPCRARTKDTKVRSGPSPGSSKSNRGLISYPDILVVCGEMEFHDAHKDVLTNPKVIIEVLSPETESFDRGEKFARFQKWNPTLSDYVLVSQDQPKVEHFTRQDDGTWAYQLSEGLDGMMTIASIKCTLKLADVYDRVSFDEQ